jgi:hypothetical protein
VLAGCNLVLISLTSSPARLRPRVLIKGKRPLMTVFQSAVDATFAAFAIDAVYTPAGGERASVRVIARRPDTIVGFGEPASTPRRQPSSFGRAKSQARARAISSPSRPTPSSSRVSRNGATPIGSSGAWILGLHEIAPGLVWLSYD